MLSKIIVGNITFSYNILYKGFKPIEKFVWLTFTFLHLRETYQVSWTSMYILTDFWIVLTVESFRGNYYGDEYCLIIYFVFIDG